MIEAFNDVEVRGTGLVLSSMFEQIKKMHAVDPDLAGELAISAIELVLTGQISSDDAMIDMLLAPAKVITDNNVQRYEARKEGSKGKKIKDMKLDDIAELYKRGVKQKEIAERLHLTQQTVSYRIGLIKTSYSELLRDETDLQTNLDVYQNTNNGEKMFVDRENETAAQTILPKNESLPKNLQTNSDVYQNTKIPKTEVLVNIQEDENACTDGEPDYSKKDFRF